MKLIREIKRKNRRIKYNEENYINVNYVVDGKAVIPVELDSTNDLFMKHDYKKFELSDDVCKYIEEIAYMIPMDMDIVIELHCPKVDEDTKKKMVKAIRNNYGMDIDDADQIQEERNRVIQEMLQTRGAIDVISGNELTNSVPML